MIITFTAIAKSPTGLVNVQVLSSGEKRTGQWLWNVTLQLADLPKNLPEAASPLVSDPEQGIFIAEFYDLVSSDFFSCAWNFPHAPRNWHSGLAEAQTPGVD